MAIVTLGSGDQNFVYKRNGPNTDTITDFGSIYFESNLTGAQETPPVATTASGEAVLVLNKTQTRLVISSTLEGVDLDGNQTAADPDDDVSNYHIHNGDPGVPGGVVFGFIAPNSDTNGDLLINAAAGTVNSAWDSNEGAGTTLGAQLADLLADGLYLNVHTASHGGGEIRGQIISEDDGNDRISLAQVNIGEFATLQKFIVNNPAGNAVLTTFFNGQMSRLVFTDVAKGDLDAGDFIFAGAVNQNIFGTVNRDDLFGAGGNDRIAGGTGNDRLYGESGNDTLNGGLGNDTVDGGSGNDRLVFATSGAVNVNLAMARSTGQGNDRIFGIEGGCRRPPVPTR